MTSKERFYPTSQSVPIRFSLDGCLCVPLRLAYTLAVLGNVAWIIASFTLEWGVDFQIFEYFDLFDGFQAFVIIVYGLAGIANFFASISCVFMGFRGVTLRDAYSLANYNRVCFFCIISLVIMLGTWVIQMFMWGDLFGYGWFMPGLAFLAIELIHQFLSIGLSNATIAKIDEQRKAGIDERNKNRENERPSGVVVVATGPAAGGFSVTATPTTPTMIAPSQMGYAQPISMAQQQQPMMMQQPMVMGQQQQQQPMMMQQPMMGQPIGQQPMMPMGQQPMMGQPMGQQQMPIGQQQMMGQPIGQQQMMGQMGQQPMGQPMMGQQQMGQPMMMNPAVGASAPAYEAPSALPSYGEALSENVVIKPSHQNI